MNPGFLAALAIGSVTWPACCLSAEAERGFESLFDGHTLEGWESPDMSYWSVEEGSIAGRITSEHPCTVNQYLVWKGGELGDFELKLKSRVRGEGAVNSGFQFRSRLLPDHDIAGYQVDNNLQTDWLVRLYDEFGRHTLAWRGQRTVFDTGGKPLHSDIPDAKGTAWFKLEEWHEYHLLGEGSRLTLKVDGRLAAEVEDNDPRRQDLSGVLGLQLHSGGPSTVQFKEIRLKVLKPAPANGRAGPQTSRAREALLKEAVAFWDLGAGAHGGRSPLVYHGSLEHCELDVLADGPGATTNARVARLSGGWFDAGKAVNVQDSEVTVYLRARDPRGMWKSALLAKGGGRDKISFDLFSVEKGATSQADIVFEVHAERGFAMVSFPMSGLDATAWHDLMGRYNGRVVEILCDGKVMASKFWEGGKLATNEELLLIGAEMDGGKVVRQFHGELEEAAVWDKWVNLPNGKGKAVPAHDATR